MVDFPTFYLTSMRERKKNIRRAVSFAYLQNVSSSIRMEQKKVGLAVGSLTYFKRLFRLNCAVGSLTYFKRLFRLNCAVMSLSFFLGIVQTELCC